MSILFKKFATRRGLMSVAVGAVLVAAIMHIAGPSSDNRANTGVPSAAAAAVLAAEPLVPVTPSEKNTDTCTPGAGVGGYRAVNGLDPAAKGTPDEMFGQLKADMDKWFAVHNTFVGAPCITWGQMMVGATAWAATARFGDWTCRYARYNATFLNEPQNGFAQGIVEAGFVPDLCGDPAGKHTDSADFDGIWSIQPCLIDRDNGLICQIG